MTDSPPLQSDRVKFIDPPVNELVVSLFHLPILELKAQHIGLYWSLINDRFPLCEQQPLVVTEGQPFITETQGELFPLPRFWFSSDKHPTLIQLQRNAFMLNWRRTASDTEYPHYEVVIQDFWREFERYTSFINDTVKGRLDVVQRCELTYVNLIERNEFFSSLSDVEGILPSLSGIKGLATDARELSGFNASINHRVNPNLFVDLTIRLGRRVDTGGIVLGLELKAHGTPGDLSLAGARTWYDAAHDATYQLFVSATSPQVQQKLWRPR
jgi:uncharacterized protein (TIGR04255 family)